MSIALSVNYRLQRSLPARRWCIVVAATILLVSIYYLNYGGGFVEGSAESSVLAFPLRVLAITMFVWALRPFRISRSPALLILIYYVILILSFVLGAALSGEFNDLLFFNTILQLPVLVALCCTTWSFDFARWFRVLSWLLVVQGAIDLLVWIGGASLWLSQAFVGGLGNPSAFGFLCVIAYAFNLFHPKPSVCRLPLAIMLFFCALMSFSLLSVISVVVVSLIWALGGLKRMFVGVLLIAFVLWLGLSFEGTFVSHKISAAAAFIGLSDYDVQSSLTVSARAEMHERTLSALATHPISLLIGHLEGKAYWPMDSQFLTYLGSFGLILLCFFLLLHGFWMACAFGHRELDGGATFIALAVFAVVFATNRVLDYFPIAIVYFMCVVYSLKNRKKWKFIDVQP